MPNVATGKQMVDMLRGYSSGSTYKPEITQLLDVLSYISTFKSYDDVVNFRGVGLSSGSIDPKMDYICNCPGCDERVVVNFNQVKRKKFCPSADCEFFCEKKAVNLLLLLRALHGMSQHVDQEMKELPKSNSILSICCESCDASVKNITVGRFINGKDIPCKNFTCKFGNLVWDRVENKCVRPLLPWNDDETRIKYFENVDLKFWSAHDKHIECPREHKHSIRIAKTLHTTLLKNKEPTCNECKPIKKYESLVSKFKEHGLELITTCDYFCAFPHTKQYEVRCKNGVHNISGSKATLIKNKDYCEICDRIDGIESLKNDEASKSQILKARRKDLLRLAQEIDIKNTNRLDTKSLQDQLIEHLNKL